MWHISTAMCFFFLTEVFGISVPQLAILIATFLTLVILFVSLRASVSLIAYIIRYVCNLQRS